MSTNQFMEMGIVIHRMISETGVNPLNIYCKATGAPIGSLTPEEWQMVWDSLEPEMDREEIMDELYSRTLACMRPSPAWNYVRRGTLNRLRISDPVRLCAWLLGRYYEPRDSAYSRVKVTYEQRILDGITKIQIYAKLSELDYDVHKLKEFTTILLMLDASFDLSLIQMFEGFPKTPMDINMNVIENYTKFLNDRYAKLADHKAKLERKAQLEQSVLSRGGNRMTREVAHKAFMEIKPKSEATLAKEHQHQMEVMFENLVREMMKPESSRVEQHQFTMKAPLKVGFKMGGIKK